MAVVILTEGIVELTGEISVVGGQIIDGLGGPPISRGTLRMSGGHITSVAESSEGAPHPPSANIFDASGCSVMPGLIDGHIHALTIAEKRSYSETEAALWGAAYLRQALLGGVTTVRDLGTHYEAIFALKRGAQRGYFVGPRLLSCGNAIAMTGGHHYDSLSVEADGPYEVMAAVRRQIKAGADAVKFMASGGAGTAGQDPRSAQLRIDEMRAGIDVAHDAGRPTAAHAHSTQGIKNAILAGIDSIEHGVFFDDEAIELALEHDVTLSPTLSVYQRIVDSKGGDLALAAFMIENSERIVAAHSESFRRCLDAGVRISLGTDGGSAYNPLNSAASYELALWIDNGMAPLAAITSGTSIAAQTCGIGNVTGSLSVGKRADVLVVEGDVLDDITALTRIRYLFRDGELVVDGRAEAQRAAGAAGVIPG